MLKYFLILGAAQLLIWAVAPKAKAEGYLNIQVKRKPASITANYKSPDILGDEMPQIRVNKKQLVNNVQVIRVDGQ
ncbi:MAG: hypothetical protein K2P92_04890 [Bdellovibrionaceae bacterium]|nr:hypothetical protein [Pseudobdellovibrionaceae bacterium]